MFYTARVMGDTVCRSGGQRSEVKVKMQCNGAVDTHYRVMFRTFARWRLMQLFTMERAEND